ncbi:hypothetical protein CU097_014450, partial [Rhizopus azygosporus]
MPIAFENFSLTEEIHQLVILPTIVEALCFVKTLIANRLILATVFAECAAHAQEQI